MKPEVVWQWVGNPYKDPANARMFMGLQKNPDGTGYKRLEEGDAPHECEFCGGYTVYKYPHSHTKAERDKEQSNG
jgi:hypothetical protein